MHTVSLKRNFRKMKKTNFKEFLINNKLLVLLSIFLLFGVFLGAVLIKLSDNKALRLIDILFLGDFKERLSRPLTDIFIASISSTFIFVLISFFMGLSMWGFILVPIIPFSRGICIGLSEGYLYSTYGIKGICFHSLIFLPGLFISSIAVLLMAREAIKISNHFSSMIFLKSKAYKVHESIKLYIIRSACITMIILISSAIDLLSNLLFLKFFSF